MGKILIADDEQSILEAMTDVLLDQGHQVVGVSDGREALFQIQLQDFDVAILDVMMPKMDGYHLAQALRGLAHPPAVLIVTSRDFEGDQQALKATGVTAFLQKPFSNSELVDVVDQLLKREK
ncbi:MAG: putative transcriptional regulatory protein YedW [Elusimicrobia bacterium]|nr:putative transcriptional regulatory protein YedW [Elusimicrobiota bacterium]